MPLSVASPIELRISGLNVTRSRRLILENLTLTLGPGVTVLLGPNGVGKTSLFERILFLGEESGGSIWLGQHTVERAGLPAFYAQTGYMPQEWTFPASFTCIQALEYAAWLKGCTSKNARALAIAALEKVSLAEHANTRLRTLSGGSRQRVGLAESLVHDPRVLLLDEPTVGLDPGQRAAFRELVRATSTSRITLLSTHLIDDVASMATRVIILNDRAIAFDGTPAELAASAPPAHRATSDIEAAYLNIVEHDLA